MKAFFSASDAVDPLYNIYRDDGFSWVGESAGDFVERAWIKCGKYCDPDLPLQARQHFQARFWELYLAFTLDVWGIALVEQRAAKGPDLRLARSAVWIEAVAVTAGTGRDAVPKPKEGVAYSIPDKEIQLRLRSAIEDKAKKLREYQEARVVDRKDALVIAVNAADVPNARSEMPLPRIVRVLFPFGVPVVNLDRNSFEVERTSHAYEAEVKKRSGNSVSTDIFLDSAYSHVSAILYCASDPINRPAAPGEDFVLVHNPVADNPLSRALLPVGQEYWEDDGQLKVLHATGRSDSRNDESAPSNEALKLSTRLARRSLTPAR